MFIKTTVSLYVLGLEWQVLVSVVSLAVSTSYQCSRLPGNTHLKNDPLRVKCDVIFS